MDTETRMRNLAEKVKGGTATIQEELELLRFLNKSFRNFRDLVHEVLEENPRTA